MIQNSSVRNRPRPSAASSEANASAAEARPSSCEASSGTSAQRRAASEASMSARASTCAGQVLGDGALVEVAEHAGLVERAERGDHARRDRDRGGTRARRRRRRGRRPRRRPRPTLRRRGRSRTAGRSATAGRPRSTTRAMRCLVSSRMSSAKPCAKRDGGTGALAAARGRHAVGGEVAQRRGERRAGGAAAATGIDDSGAVASAGRRVLVGDVRDHGLGIRAVLGEELVDVERAPRAACSARRAGRR